MNNFPLMLINNFMKKRILLTTLSVVLVLFACTKDDIAKKNDDLIKVSAKMGAEVLEPTQFIGSVVGFNDVIRIGGGPSPTSSGKIIYNQPLYKSSTAENDWWDNLVEEFAYSGMDFFAANCRGYSLVKNVDHGDPRKIALLCQAMDRRGVSNKFKIAVFDDCPSSWCANKNVDNGQPYNTDTPFDCGNTANYKYIWDLNIKTAFLNIPDSKRFKYKGRPVIFFWAVYQPWAINTGNSNLKKILQYVRTQFNATFGQNPYIVINRAWLSCDATVNDPTVIDAIDNWFNMANPSTLYTFNGEKTGAGVAGFNVVQGTTNMVIDANHGQTLINTLNNTRGAGAGLTLLEGFTDCAENAAIFRSKDVTYYDYPNQRINIVRRYSNDPYPTILKVEAEGCDFYNDLSAGNSGGQYRDGNIDIVKTGDVNGGWHVNNTQPNEWMEWKELPFKAGNTKFQIRYSSQSTSAIRFNVDGVDLAMVDLPISGFGVYASVDAGSISFTSDGLHTVRLKIISGSAQINYFNRVSY